MTSSHDSPMTAGAPAGPAGSERRKPRMSGLSARLLLILVLAAAWVAGSFRTERDIRPFLAQVFPDADRFEPAPGGTYSAWRSDGEEPLGYAGVGTAQGYAGDLKVVVAVSAEGRVIAAAVASHKETASFFERVEKKGFLQGLTGKVFDEDFVVGRDVDGVTAATYTSRALADAVRRAGREVAGKVLSLPVPEEAPPSVEFGWPEAALIGLFLFGVVRRRKDVPRKKLLRGISLGAGLVLLGFILNRPLNLVFINKILVGDWPTWQLNLYWYILLGGVVLFAVLDKSNPYCEGFCPFGAIQEGLGLIGGGRPPGRRLNLVLLWIQRGLALGLIVVALLARKTSLYNYEVSGALFSLVGSAFLFGLLAVVLIASLFVDRPWCRGLCPVRPVTDFLKWMRGTVSRSQR